MTRITLVHFQKVGNLDQSIGLGYLKAMLKGHEVNIVNLIRTEKDNSYMERLCGPLIKDNEIEWDNLISSFKKETYTPETKKITNDKPEIVGFSLFNISVMLALLAAKHIKKRMDTKIVFGGPVLSNRILQEKLLKFDFIDHIIIGEAEEVFKRLADGEEMPKKIECKQPNIDNLPAPIYEKDVKIIPVSASRGCVYNCLFCTGRLLTPGYRERKTCHVVDDIEKLDKKHNTDRFWFYDSLLNQREERLDEISDEIIRRKLKIYWGCYVKSIRHISPELAKKMYLAGCRFVRIGLESGSKEVLRHMRKGISLETLKQNAKTFYDADIYVRFSIIVGYPTEKNKDFLDTFCFLIDNHEIYNIFEHFMFCLQKTYLETDNPLLKIPLLDHPIVLRRHKLLHLFKKAKGDYASDLFNRNFDYRNWKNTNERQIFHRPVIINNKFYGKTTKIISEKNGLLKIGSKRYLRPEMTGNNLDYDALTRPAPICARLKDNLMCNECMEFIKIKDNKISVCHRFFDEMIKPEIKKGCKSCMIRLRGKCFPCYYAKNSFLSL